ncbi:MAG: NAD-dependent protein deacylase [Porticoccus sp.]|nr:NAD-dependent protein deacylase [Porticoccus sp.]
MAKKHYQSVVVLTGAGISAESGIRTFRASDGLWEDHHIEDVASPEGFARDPDRVHRFYNQRRDQLLSQSIEPNPAHFSLADFELKFSENLSRDLTKSYTLITQNIDDLHERAGSSSPLHMHGELLKIRCSQSGRIFECRDNTTPLSKCPCCGMSGNLRPHVVWFGEMPLYMNEIYQALNSCDLFIAIGTSGNVYPAAGFFETAKMAGAHTVELNLEPSINGSQFAEQHYGPASEVIPHYVKALLAG